MTKDDLYFAWLLCLIALFGIVCIIVVAAVPNPAKDAEHAVVIDTSNNDLEIQLDNGSRVFIRDYKDESIEYGDGITVQLVDGYYHLVEED